jgi:hypothetical protein
MPIKKIEAGRVITQTIDSFIGTYGTIWYDEETGEMRLYDGNPGGISLGAGGSGYVLNTATTTRLGGVRIGAGISVSPNGTISVNTSTRYVLTTATTTTLGGVKIGNNLSITQDGTLSATSNVILSDNPPVDPTIGTLWYDTVSGRMYVWFDSSWIDANPQTIYVLNTATTNVLGGIKVGQNLSINSDGTLNAISIVSSNTAPVNPNSNILWYDTVSGRLYTWFDNSWIDASPQTAIVPATTSTLGGVKIGNNLSITQDGTLSATSSVTSNNNPPLNPTVGTLWYDTVSGRLYTWFDNSWIDTSPQTAIVPATTSTLGGVKIGAGINISIDGTISVNTSTQGGGNGYTGSTGTQGIRGYTGSTGTQGITGYTGSQGQGFTFRGEWANGVGYVPYDVVTFGGETYVNILSTTGLQPGNTICWTKIAAKGAIGYTGSTGTQGVTGYTGSTGTQGITGYTGSTGTQGVTGYTGSTGTQGITGYTGSTGTQGEIGYTGSTGTQGITGYTGSTGTQGEIGYTGSTGTQGITGYTGSTGTQGEIGYTGSTGTQGVTGYTGSQGKQGVSNNIFYYNADTNTYSGYPGNGKLLWDNPAQTSSTNIIVSHLSSDDVDIDIYLSLIQKTQQFIVQDRNNSGNYQNWYVGDNPTNTNTGTTSSYWTIPVTLIDSGGVGDTPGFSDNHELILGLISGTKGDIGYTGSAGSFTGTTEQIVNITNITPSTSTYTGALVVAGGVGISGSLYVASTSYINGAQILTTAELQTVTHTATYITNDAGTVPGLTSLAGTTSTVYGTYNFGSVSDIWTFNDFNTSTNFGYYSIQDAATQPAFIVYIGFEGITDFNRIVLNINYTQSSGHTQDIDLYNYVQNQWDTFTTYSGSAGWFEFILGTIDSRPYISNNKVTARIYHVNFGNTAHRTWIDYVALEKSIQGGQGPRGSTGAQGIIGYTGSASKITVSEINAASSLTNTVTNVTAIRFDKDTGFSVTDLGAGEVKISLGSSFKTWKVAGQSSLVAFAEDTVEFIAGDGVTLTTNPNTPNKSLTITGNMYWTSVNW